MGSAAATPVATATTTASGTFTLSYTPTANASYTVSSPPISQIEVPSPTLTPPFGDLLQPTSKSIGSSKVTGAPRITTIRAVKGVVTIKGTLSPKVSGSAASLRVYAGKGATGASSFVSAQTLRNGATSFTAKVTLKRGFTWRVSVKYVNTGQIVTGTSPARSVRVT
jgi:hypothetical protein